MTSGPTARGTTPELAPARGNRIVSPRRSAEVKTIQSTAPEAPRANLIRPCQTRRVGLAPTTTMKIASLIVAGLLLASASIAQTCVFTNFGRPCGGTLTGALVRGPALQFDVAQASAGAHAVLVVGQQQRPAPLPGSMCPLLVNPRILLHSQIDRAGNARWTVRVPNQRIDVDLQVVTLESGRNGARIAESTNGVNLVCR